MMYIVPVGNCQCSVVEGRQFLRSKYCFQYYQWSLQNQESFQEELTGFLELHTRLKVDGAPSLNIIVTHYMVAVRKQKVGSGLHPLRPARRKRCSKLEHMLARGRLHMHKFN